MKRLLVGMSAAALIAFVQPQAAFAQHGASAHTPPPTSHATTTHGPTTHVTTAHGSSSHGPATHGPATHGPATHGPSPHAAATHGASSHGTTVRSHASSKRTTRTNGKTTTTTTTTTTTSGTALTPVQQKLQRNTKLASKLQSLLPAGTNLMTAANGFRNFGQFVAAVHVSNNLGIPFSQLKTDMVTRGMSLGRSIQDLRPSANSTVEVEHAEHEADVDIRTTTTTTTTRKRSHQ